MNKNKTTKRALISSVLALVLCVSMLIGTTYAWFTDSVTNTGNIIQSGTLKVTMEWADGTTDPETATWTDASEGAIFSSELWEPGYTEARHIKIANEGTLALKYQLHIVANGEVSKLADVIDVYYVDPAVQVAGRTQLKEENKMGTLTEVLANLGGEESTAVGNLLADENHTITLALKMQESAGNEYQNLAIGSDFSIMLFATQYTSESDSFDNQYDEGAELPGVAKATSQAELASAISDGADTVYLAGGTYKLPGTTNNEITLIGNGNTVVDLSYATGQSLSGTDVTLENLTVTGANQDYTGLQHVGNVVYNNVVFNNSTNLYGESVTFNDCTFNLTSRYIWTYGAGVATFNNCTFYTEGKAILAYKESDPATYTVNINDCTFYATEAGYTSSGDHCAAVEIDSSLVGAYVINFNGTNTVSTNFYDLYRIKNRKDPANATVNQNGTVVTTDWNPVSNGLYTDGNGKYGVSNAAGMATLNTIISKNVNRVELLADIDMSGTPWTMVDMQADANGKLDTFNGNGKTISNLVIDGEAMFSRIASSADTVTFSDIVFKNVTIDSTSSNTAIITKQTYKNLVLDNVDVNVASITGETKVATLVGTVFNEASSTVTLTVKNCDISDVEITGKPDDASEERLAGLVAWIADMYSNEAIELENNTMTNVAINSNSTASEHHALIYISDKSASNRYGVYHNEDAGVKLENCTYVRKVADGLYTDLNGDFYVYNANGLQALKNFMDSNSNKGSVWGKTYNIMANIDATNVNWTTKFMVPDSASFNGFTFNGNGHTISNLTIKGQGLFTGTSCGSQSNVPATFKNITFDNATVTGGTHHNGVVWGEAYGDITLEKVSVTNSKVSGGCNVGGLVGRNSESHATFKFVDCSVKNTTVEATTSADHAGASAFLGMALHLGETTSAEVIFEGTNVSEGNTLTTGTGMQGGGIYTIATWGETTWNTPTVVNDFTNYDSNNK